MDVALACCFLLCDALAAAQDTVARLEGWRNELSA